MVGRGSWSQDEDALGGWQHIFQIFGMLAGSLWCQLSPAVGKVPLCAMALPVCQAIIESVHSFSAPSNQCIFPSLELPFDVHGEGAASIAARSRQGMVLLS